MKTRMLILTLTFLFVALAAHATAYEEVLCPPYVGTFHSSNSGLTVTIVQENDKAVAAHTELLANPVTGADAEAMVRRGEVQFNAHIDKESGRWFVHWETVHNAKQAH